MLLNTNLFLEIVVDGDLGLHLELPRVAQSLEIATIWTKIVI